MTEKIDTHLEDPMPARKPQTRSGSHGETSSDSLVAALRALNELAHRDLPEPAEGGALGERLRSHFGQDCTRLPSVAESFAPHEHPNVHLAVEACLEGLQSELLGLVSEQSGYGASIHFADLVAPGRSVPREAPVEYANLRIDEERVLACVQRGLFLVREGANRLALLVQGPSRNFQSALTVEVMAPERAQAEAFLSRVRAAMRQRNVYRGRVLTISSDRMENLKIAIQHLPSVGREQIIFPAGLLDKIERQTIRFSGLSEKLRSAGRHLKRGVLLYGPPGTGKTFTAMYLASQMVGRTVLVVTGRAMGLIEQACALARALQPATVLVEDVDLIAEARGEGRDNSCNGVLFELLNQMDGLGDDADILFLLTTNRPDILEPALAARPGRVDLALEVPVPDAECRRRLLKLYAQGLTLEQGYGRSVCCGVEPFHGWVSTEALAPRVATIRTRYGKFISGG
jgi:hypothetical protein